MEYIILVNIKINAFLSSHIEEIEEGAEAEEVVEDENKYEMNNNFSFILVHLHL